MNTPGKTAYEAYCEACNWSYADKKPLPHFEQQTLLQQAAWEKAAEAVLKEQHIATAYG